jgi:hypothetical protein
MRNEGTARVRGALVDAFTRCVDTCRASELHCTIAMDVVVALHDDRRDGQVLRDCAATCASTAASIGALHEPDLDAVASALLACRSACSAAQRACRKRPFDACCGACAEICAECAAACEELLAAAPLVAA